MGNNVYAYSHEKALEGVNKDLIKTVTFRARQGMVGGGG